MPFGFGLAMYLSFQEKETQRTLSNPLFHDVISYYILHFHIPLYNEDMPINEKEQQFKYLLAPPLFSNPYEEDPIQFKLQKPD
jgi:hypothetical protein